MPSWPPTFPFLRGCLTCRRGVPPRSVLIMGLLPQVLHDARHGSHVTSDTRSGRPKAKPLFPRSTVCLGGGSVTSQPAPKPGSMGPLPVFCSTGAVWQASEQASLRGSAYSRDDPLPPEQPRPSHRLGSRPHRGRASSPLGG